MIFLAASIVATKQALIAGSYILTPERTGFIRTEYASEGSPTQNVYYTYTENQGNTWKNVALAEQTAAVRFRKLTFWPRRFWLHFSYRVAARNGAGRLSLICDPRWWQDLAGKASG